jgi:DNA-damage-inducible protein D
MNFDDIKHIDDNDAEYWLARELQEVLKYKEWRNFNKVINTAKIACNISKQDIDYHFVEATKTIDMPKGAKKQVVDYKLTRFACYLIVMNGDPRKEIIAFGQTYFAVKTRQQEIQDLYELMNEDERRLYIRGDIKQKNMLLAESAHKAGIKTSFEYAAFQDYGYTGLYGGETAKIIAARKGLKSGADILDHMGSVELGANLFRITQTQDVMDKNKVSTPQEANATHHRIGKIVREAMEKSGGTLPENLPTPEKSVKEIETDALKRLKGN